MRKNLNTSGPSPRKPCKPPFGRKTRWDGKAGVWRDRGYHFDVVTADRAADFFPEMLRHVKGEWAGRPLVLERWERNIIPGAEVYSAAYQLP